jgi:hypothetical protein
VSAEHDDTFADVLAANDGYMRDFRFEGLSGTAARGLAVLTCMDSRIEPLAMLGLRPGDAKILRNAGARVTDDVLRTLVLASYLLGVDRVMIIAHTNCRMAGGTEEDVHAAVRSAGGPDTQPRLPRDGRSGGDGARRRAAGAIAAVPDGASCRRLSLRRGDGAPHAALLTASARISYDLTRASWS